MAIFHLEEQEPVRHLTLGLRALHDRVSLILHRLMINYLLHDELGRDGKWVVLIDLKAIVLEKQRPLPMLWFILFERFGLAELNVILLRNITIVNAVVLLSINNIWGEPGYRKHSKKSRQSCPHLSSNIYILILF